MTPETYAEIQANLGKLIQEERTKLIEIYKAAAKHAGEVIQDTIERGLSELTKERWDVIKNQLEDVAKSIADATDESLQKLIDQGYNLTAGIEKTYLMLAIEESGAASLIDFGALNNVYSGINERLIRATVTRIFKDGYNYSDKIWSGLFDKNGNPVGVYGDWLTKVKNLVAGGMAQGIDPAKIAKDLYAFTVSKLGAQDFIAGRWGQLKPGAADYIRRLGKSGIDYRAIRIVRSELYRGLHDAAIMNAQTNPGWDGMFDWILTSGREKWPCACAGFAKEGPYTLKQLPGYPHPNCMCIIQPSLIPREKFVQMLADWTNGAGTEGADQIQAWVTKHGLAA